MSVRMCVCLCVWVCVCAGRRVSVCVAKRLNRKFLRTWPMLRVTTCISKRLARQREVGGEGCPHLEWLTQAHVGVSVRVCDELHTNRARAHT